MIAFKLFFMSLLFSTIYRQTWSVFGFQATCTRHKARTTYVLPSCLLQRLINELVSSHGLPDCFNDRPTPYVSLKEHIKNAVYDNHELIDYNHNWLN